MPDSPAPTMSTSTCSGAVGSAGRPPAPSGSLVTGGIGMAAFSVGVLGRQVPVSGRCRGTLLRRLSTPRRGHQHDVETDYDGQYAGLVSVPASDRPSAVRGRRPVRPSGDDRELAILATAERLLAERPLSAISVDDLARGAGISRPTFYFYFPSKDAVLLTLLDRIIAEADERADEALGPMDTGVDPAGVWRAINALFKSFSAHRPVMIAGS